AVPVSRDSAYHPVDEVTHPGSFQVSEPEGVERRDRPRSHREDVAQNAAHAGRGALVWLDEGRVIVGLHLEGDGQAVADVDDAGVFAGPLDHAGTARRELLQVDAGRLVRAVL